MSQAGCVLLVLTRPMCPRKHSCMCTQHQVPELAEAIFSCANAMPVVQRVAVRFQWTLPAFQRVLHSALSSLLSGGPSAVGRIPGLRFPCPQDRNLVLQLL